MKRLIIIAFLLGSQWLYAQDNSKTAKVRIQYGANKNADSVKLFVTERHFSYTVSSQAHEVPLTAEDSTYNIEFPKKDEFRYFTVITKSTVAKRKYLLFNYLIEPGDDVTIIIDGNNYNFRGKSFEKFDLLRELAGSESVWRKTFRDSLKRSKNDTTYSYKGKFDEEYYNGLAKSLGRAVEYFYSKINYDLKILKKYQHLLSSGTYDVIKNNLIGTLATDVHFAYHFSYVQLDPERLQTPVDVNGIREKLYNTYRSFYVEVRKKISERTMLKSIGFVDFILNNAYSTTSLKEDGFKWIEKNFTGELKERLIVLNLIKSFAVLKNEKEKLHQITLSVKSDYYANMITDLTESLSVGTKAYNFSLSDISGKTVRMEDFRGKTVVMDFWYTGCVNCAILTPYLKKVMDKVKSNADIVFLSISVDPDKHIWLQSVKSHIYSNPGAVELYTNGDAFRHPIVIHYQIAGYPRLIIVGKDGNIISSNPPRPVDQQKTDNFVSMLLQ